MRVFESLLTRLLSGTFGRCYLELSRMMAPYGVGKGYAPWRSILSATGGIRPWSFLSFGGGVVAASGPKEGNVWLWFKVVSSLMLSLRRWLFLPCSLMFRRRCPGMHIANTYIYMVISRMISLFVVTSNGGYDTADADRVEFEIGGIVYVSFILHCFTTWIWETSRPKPFSVTLHAREHTRELLDKI